MSFNATLYNCSDDPRKLSKNLENGTSISTIMPTESCDILNPVFILNYNANYATKNYIVVGSPFNRSYFITDMKIDIGKKIVISCAVDVLQTYKDDILKITANVVRNENLIKDMLPDPNFVYLNENDVISKNITASAESPLVSGGTDTYRSIILCVAGSANAHGEDIDGYTLLGSQPANWNTAYMFYWVNVGTYAAPDMCIIGELISQGVIQPNPLFSDLVEAYGGVYQKNQS